MVVRTNDVKGDRPNLVSQAQAVGTGAPQGQPSPSDAPSPAQEAQPQAAYVLTLQRELSLPELRQTYSKFRIDEASRRIIIQVVDAKSGELVRVIPPESLARMMDSLHQSSGLLFDTRS
jgi:uncharacterized FlaG/YvyC family protein